MPKITRVHIPPKLPTLKRAAAYARVSVDKDTMQNSMSAQVSYYSSYIQNRNDWEYVGVYADEALSGTKAERPEFQRLLADCRGGKIDIIITKSISRFARNTVVLLETVRELKLMGIDVYFERENIHSLSADGELMLSILASYAQEESRNVSENCKWRIQKEFKKGEAVGFVKMYGYDYNNGAFTINEEQAAVVRQVFDWYISGLGKVAIARKLNEMGVPTFEGKQWIANRVDELITNEKLMGHVFLQKTFVECHLSKKQRKNRGELQRYYVENNHPAIISTDTFEKAQQVRKARAERFKAKDNSGKVYPFSGMIVCGICRKKYNRHKGVGKFYWHCTTFLREGKAACSSRQIPEDMLKALTAEVLGLTEPRKPPLDTSLESSIDTLLKTAIKNQISEIQVPGDNRLAFVFSNGNVINRKWKYQSRRNSWTDEMKQEARERSLLHHRQKRRQTQTPHAKQQGGHD